MLFVKLLLYRMIYIVYVLLITLTPLPCELCVQKGVALHTATVYHQLYTERLWTHVYSLSL